MCGSCRGVKPLADFGADAGSPDYVNDRCRDCVAAYYDAHRTERRLRAARYQQQNPEKTILYRRRGRAEQSGIPFTITADDILIPESCPVCDVALQMPGQGSRTDASASLDRYQPDRGYVPGNVWVICMACNIRKFDQTGEQLMAFGQRVADAFRERSTAEARVIRLREEIRK
jgi:hypothetical protein